jgi:hypothetical protein
MNTEIQKRKRAAFIATGHLAVAYFVMSALDGKRQAFIPAGIWFFVAIWIEYRFVRAYRRAKTSEGSANSGSSAQ